MKILAMIMLVLLILAVGFVGYVYKKNAMFLPALFGICLLYTSPSPRD